LSAQSAQQIIGEFCEFCEAVESCRQLRTNGHTEARYPWRLRRYHDVIDTNQDARIRDGRLLLPHSASGTLRVHLPDAVTLPGRLIEVRLSNGVVRLICEIANASRPEQAVIGVDLGVNTLIAATDGRKVILISGRAAKATIQYRNKQLARLQQVQAAKVKGSRRHKRLQRRKYRMLDQAKRRVCDLCHKATRHMAEAFPGAMCYVGEPFTDAAQRIGRVQAQQVSAVCTRRLYPQAHQPAELQDGWRNYYQRSPFLADVSHMRRAEQTAQDLSLPIVRGYRHASRDWSGQYPVAWRS
jgi:putative transposase